MIRRSVTENVIKALLKGFEAQFEERRRASLESVEERQEASDRRRTDRRRTAPRKRRKTTERLEARRERVEIASKRVLKRVEERH